MLFQSFSQISFPYANVLSNSPSIIIHLSYIPIQLEIPSASRVPFSVTIVNIQTYKKGAAPFGAAPAEWFLCLLSSSRSRRSRCYCRSRSCSRFRCRRSSSTE